MPPMFPVSAVVLPSVPTRKALVVVDLQRDFVGADGALPVTEPEGFVSRTLELVKAFRSSGAGDVIWVRTEFERNRPLNPDDDKILVSDLPIRRPPGGARRPPSRSSDKTLKKDDEAFLTVSPGGSEQQCVRKGTPGAELAPEVQDAVVAGRDIVYTKTDYSAFAPGQKPQLVQMLRGRFVTKMYLCGALTNVSIYATALDAGMHGYEMTLVEDCCGFRREIRHLNAVKQLAHITGCGTMKSPEIIGTLKPPKPEKAAVLSTPKEDGEKGADRGKDVKDQKDEKDQKKETSSKPVSTGLSPVLSHMTIGPSSPSPTTSSVSPPSIPATSSAALPQASSHTVQPTTPPRSTSNPSDDNKSGASTSSLTPLDDTVIEPDSQEEDNDSQELSHLRFKALLASAASQRRNFRTRHSAAPPTTSTKTTDIQPRTLARPRQTSRSPETEPSGKSLAERTSPVTKLSKPSSQAAPIKAVSNSPSTEAASSTSDRDSSEADTKAPSPEPKPTTMAQAPPSVVSEPMCAGDTTIITNILPPDLAEVAFERLLSEVSWATMSHLGGEVPRRIAVQGAVDKDGNMPVYRHPADESPPLLPFTPTVLAIKAATEAHLGHSLNHVLIQHYRSGADYISEHSDKTLDVAPTSFIANVSLGAERTMLFRTKRPPKDTPKGTTPKDNTTPKDTTTTTAPTANPQREIHRAPLPHNSLCRMGLLTNARYLHAIRPDRRADRDKSPAQLGPRISLTFRLIGTYIDSTQSLIWGQGAVAKTRESARPVINGQTPDAVRLLHAFGAENNTSDFDWQSHYGAGFDVLHMGAPKRFCACVGDAVASAAVGIALGELGVGCARGSVDGGREVRFEDNDPGRTTVEGVGTVLRYLDAVYGAGRRYDQMGGAEVARRFSLLQAALDAGVRWRAAVVGGDRMVLEKVAAKAVVEWEGHAKKAAEGKGEGEPVYIAGGTGASPADFAFWPVLNDMVRECREGVLDVDGEEGCLRRYYRAFGERGSVKKVLGLGPREGGEQEGKGE